MEVSEVFSSSTLKASDLKGREVTVTIENIEAKKFDDGNKLVISFKGAGKSLVCNKTNANRIAYVYGTDTDRWIGQRITLYVDLVDFKGDIVEAIRVRPPQQASVAGNGSTITTAPQRMAEHERNPQPPMRQPPPSLADHDDDIPF